MRNQNPNLLLLLLLIASIAPLNAFSQGRTPSEKQLKPVPQIPPDLGPSPYMDRTFPDAPHITPAGEGKPSRGAASSQKTQAVLSLGSASNVYTSIRPQQNQVWANDSLDMVVFLHRQDISVFGGQASDNGRYRYDISTNGGTSWATDVGYLQQSNTNYGRYPNVTGYNVNNSQNPLDIRLVFGGPTALTPLPSWVGHVYGDAQVVTTTAAAASSTEEYLFDADSTFIPGSMVQGLPGEFWMVENEYDGTHITDHIRVLKGTWNAAANPPKVDWVVEHLIDPGFDDSYDSTNHGDTPMIAFDPGGMNGWIAFAGNILNGSNNRRGPILPVFLKTTDGGDTWGPAYEVNLDAFPWVADSLQSLWETSPGNPSGSGFATCVFFNSDLTVDYDGNPHFATVVFNMDSADNYLYFPGLAKFICDVHSSDGGATWDVDYLAPVLTTVGSFGSGNNIITMPNYVQASRTEDGNHLFFSWADSDTSLFSGSMNGIGFGEYENEAPNLRIVAKRADLNWQSYPVTVSDGNPIWDGGILFPTMAPTVRSKNGNWHLPIVATELTNNSSEDPVYFYYWGNEATFSMSTTLFCPWEIMSLGWDVWGAPNFVDYACTISTDPQDGPTSSLEHDLHPNPNSGEAVLRIRTSGASHLEVELLDMYGRTVRRLASREFEPGRHDIPVHTQDLAAGIYHYRIQADGETFTGKMLVLRQL